MINDTLNRIKFFFKKLFSKFCKFCKMLTHISVGVNLYPKLFVCINITASQQHCSFYLPHGADIYPSQVPLCVLGQVCNCLD